MENFSPFCRCLAYAVKSLIKKHLRLHEKNFSPGSRGEVPAPSRQAGIPPNRAENFSCNRVQPGLKVSRTCVFGMFAFITQTKMASAGSTPNLSFSQTSDESSKQRLKWNDGDKIDNLLMALQNYKSNMEFSNVDFNRREKPKQYEAVRLTLALIYEADPYQFGPVEVAPITFQCPVNDNLVIHALVLHKEQAQQ